MSVHEFFGFCFLLSILSSPHLLQRRGSESTLWWSSAAQQSKNTTSIQDDLLHELHQHQGQTSPDSQDYENHVSVEGVQVQLFSDLCYDPAFTYSYQSTQSPDTTVPEWAKEGRFFL